MNNKQYYIKYIWGPAGQQGYPNDINNVITFAEGGEKQCERFRNCAGFLLYETSHSIKGLKGAKAIYARGIVDPNQNNLGIKPGNIGAGGKRWTSGVRIILKKRVDPKEGIPLNKIKELTSIRIIQRRGGLLSITEDQFKTLEKMLEGL